MQYPHFAPPDSTRYGTNRGVQRYRCQACQQIFQTLRRGKDPALKQQPVSSILKEWGCDLKVLWAQIKHLPTMDYGADMLQAYKISFHTPSITQERPSPHKSNHSIADSGII